MINLIVIVFYQVNKLGVSYQKLLFPVLLQAFSHRTCQVFALFVSDVLHRLLHLYRVSYNFKFALLGKLSHTLYRSACPSERSEVTQIAAFNFAYQYFGKQGLDIRINLIAISGTTNNQTTVFEDICNNIGRIAFADVVHHDIFDALCR